MDGKPIALIKTTTGNDKFIGVVSTLFKKPLTTNFILQDSNVYLMRLTSEEQEIKDIKFSISIRTKQWICGLLL